MDERLKDAARLMIKSCARQNDMKASEVLKAFRASDKGHSSFAALILGEDKPSQLQIDQYKFLYDIIDNFYIRDASEFSDLSFFPRMEDLFAIQPCVSNGLVAAEPELPWNKQQKQAFNSVFKWLRTKDRKQIFRLFGWAGTGKTVMAKKIERFVLEEAGKNNVPTGGILVAAYTGKACSVLRTKGFRTADTLHSLLYKPDIDPDTGRCIRFVLNHESPLATCGLLIVDEVSMVNEEMAEDILSFGCPILVLGDPEQLPPVEGNGYFIEAEPDFMLTDVERQAKENPIIYLATRARLGKIIKPGKYGTSVVYDSGKYLDPEQYGKHDQILCGINNTRTTLNKKVRRYLGYSEQNAQYPVKGEKIICLRNNKNLGLYNGTMWTLDEDPVMQKIKQPIFKGSTQTREGKLDVLKFLISSLDERDANGLPHRVDTSCSPHHFNSSLPEPGYRELVGSEQFFFGHCITTHKGQGSQWPSVLLIDESSVFRDMRHRHRYTGITRAAEALTIML